MQISPIIINISKKTDLINTYRTADRHTFQTDLINTYRTADRHTFQWVQTLDCQPTTTLNVYKRFCETWATGVPGLLISINGGAKKMGNFNSDQKQDFKCALTNVAKHANTWIITAGFNTGVMRLTGNAAKQYKTLNDNVKNFKLIGIVTYAKVNGIDKISNGDLTVTLRETKLNAHHDAFIFYDDSIDKSHDSQIKFRTPFEKMVADEAGCPIVQVIIDGGENSIKTAAEAIKQGISIVVIKGSKRAADVLGEAVENPSENKVDIITRHLNVKPDKVKELIDCLQDIQNKRHMVIVLPIEEIARNLDTAIMKAAFIVRPNYSKLLELQMSYNRFDVAEDRIHELLELPSVMKEGVDKGQQLNYVIRAWNENLYQFMLLFATNGLKIRQYLNQIKLYDVIPVKYLTQKEIDVVRFLNLTTINLEKDFSENYNVSQIYWTFYVLTGSLYSYSQDTALFEKSASMTDLFMFCIVIQRFGMAKVMWRYCGGNYICTALLGCSICSELANIADQQGEEENRIVYLRQMNEYMDLAIGIITEAYVQDKKRAGCLIINASREGSVLSTAMDIAAQNSFMDFLNHEVCQAKLNEIWYGKLSPHNSLFKLWMALAAFFLIPVLIKFKVTKKDKKGSKLPEKDFRLRSNSRRMSVIKNERIVSKDDNYYTNAMKIKLFYFAPITRFMMSLVSYLTFLMTFTYVCLVEIKPVKATMMKDRIGEYLVYIYVFTLAAEEVRQMTSNNDTNQNMRYKLSDWFSSFWNKLDLVILSEFIVAVIIRYIDALDFVYARTLYSLSLSLFYFRFMQFYLPLKTLGPKIIMISQMVKDIIFFLAIYLIVVLAYGTFSQGLLYHNFPLSFTLVKAVFYQPYWQTYGNLNLGLIEGTIPLDGVNPSPNAMVVVAFALFMLCSNILLLNLLIAMFGDTFSKIESVSHMIWSFNRQQIIREYYERTVFPPPVNLIELLIRQCLPKLKKGKSEFICDAEDCENHSTAISSFEKVCMQFYLRKTDLLSPSNSTE